MKLTEENIRAIEALLTRYEAGEPARKICPVGNTDGRRNNVFFGFLQLLRAIGISARPLSHVSPNDISEFLAWKAEKARSRLAAE